MEARNTASSDLGEPPSEWAERRDSKIGRLRAVPSASGDGTANDAATSRAAVRLAT